MRPFPANSHNTGRLALVTFLLLAGCQLALGGDRTSGRIVGGGELTDQISVQLSPGALRSPDDGPLAWLSVPTAELTLTASSDPDDDISLPIANVAPSASLSVQSVRGVTNADDPACDRSGSVTDCRQSNDPVCDIGRFRRDSPTRGSVAVSMPPCRSATFQLTPSSWRNPDRGATLAVVGDTSSARRLPAAAERANEAGADLLVLLGDHVDRGTSNPAAQLADRTDQLPLPVVVLPGEGERVDDSLVEFERQFGPVDLQWRIGGVDFLAPDSSAGGLGRDGLSTLRRDLRNIGRNTSLVALTHRPPLDPDGLRDRGFTSRIEGARTTSLLADFRTNLLVAGHLTATVRDRIGGIPLQVISSTSPTQLVRIEVPPNDEPLDRRTIAF